jgi:hypothetical protein
MGNSVGIRHEASGSRKINFTPFKPFNHYESPTVCAIINHDLSLSSTRVCPLSSQAMCR